MRNSRQNSTIIALRVTPDQKTQLQRMAALKQKSLSKFVIDSVLSAPAASGASGDKKDVVVLKQLYVANYLLLHIGAEIYKSGDKITQIYQNAKAEAQKNLNVNGEE